MAIKRIPTTSVEMGMYLCGIDRSWLNTPFLVHRFLITSPSIIAKLKEAGIQEITIDTDRGCDVAHGSGPPRIHHDVVSTWDPPISDSSVPPDVARLDQLLPSAQGKSLSGELNTMKLVRKYMLEGVQDILCTLQKTGRLAMDQVHQITESIMAETLRHEEACIAMIRTRDFSPALFDHALAVSTLAVLLGRAVGLDHTALQHLASAGLLHDTGLLNIPQILHRPLNQISDAELSLYRKHSQRGVELLSQHSSLPDEVDTLIREHHIALDGSGYPANIDPVKIHTSTRILRIVDEYDELLTGHHTGNPLQVRGALQMLYQQGKKGLIDGALVATFINLIGIYPTYALVELNTGERGIVTANSRENLLQPMILLIQDALHQPLSEPIPLNFSVLSSHEPRPEIVRVLAPEQLGIDLDSALENWMTL